MTVTKVTVECELECGERVDTLLAARIPELTRSALTRIFDAGGVTLGGEMVKKSYRARPGDIFTVMIPDVSHGVTIAESIPLSIVYEDSDLIVVDKPRGMVVHPSPGHEMGTLVNALLSHCPLSSVGGEFRPGIVHRLDKDTSGLLVVAKNDFTHVALSLALSERRVSREYEAIVHGVMKADSGTINAPLGRHPRERKLQAVVYDSSRAAITHYSVLERYERHTLVQCRLETGRTHQIRVHMTHIGHPLVGDMQYGHKRCEYGVCGQCLHARTLRFNHPRTGELLEFTVAVPLEFERVKGKLAE